MAVTTKDLRKYLRAPDDTVSLTGDASINIDTFAAAVKESGTYTFVETDDGWTLNGSATTLSEYGIVAGEEETEITVQFETENLDKYISAAQSKAGAAGIPAFQNNAQYDLFIMALASMYYDNRGMVFDDPRNEQTARNMINCFVLELRYAREDLA